MGIQKCQECGSPLIKVNTCQDYFNQMLAWDFEDPSGAGRYHHLTVLCFNLQHPTMYSKEGLEIAKNLLKEFIDMKDSSSYLYKKLNDEFSKPRDWSIQGNDKNHGKYSVTPKWRIFAYDVVKDGREKYPKHVEEWANEIYKDLKYTGEIAS